MKPKVLLALVVFTTYFLLVPSAFAAWGNFKNMGKTPSVGEPSCASLGSKNVVCVTRSQQNTLMVNQYTNNAWVGWTNLPDVVGSDPNCLSDGSGNIICAVETVSSTLAVTVFNGKNWGALVDSSGQISSAPSCGLVHNGKILCAARSLTGNLTASAFSAGKWGKFITNTAMLTSGPGCAGDSDGDVICVMNAIASANNNTIVANRFNGTKWDGFLTLQGSVSGSNPSCTPLGVKGQVVCFDRADNTAIYRNMFKSGIWQNSNWTGWGAITGAEVGPTFSCGMPSAGTLACAAHSLADSFMYGATFDGTNWSSFTKIGTKPIFAGPGCTQYSAGQVICSAVGLNTQPVSVTGP